MNYHWTLLLTDREHVLNEIFQDFGMKKLVKCGYMFFGYLRADKKLGIRTVIIHYHTTDETARFDEIQNIDSYSRIDGLNDGDLEYLALTLDRGMVAKMSKAGIIQEKHLTYIEKADILVVVNEKGECKEYGTVYKENHREDSHD